MTSIHLGDAQARALIPLAGRDEPWRRARSLQVLSTRSPRLLVPPLALAAPDGIPVTDPVTGYGVGRPQVFVTRLLSAGRSSATRTF